MLGLAQGTRPFQLLGLIARVTSFLLEAKQMWGWDSHLPPLFPPISFSFLILVSVFSGPTASQAS